MRNYTLTKMEFSNLKRRLTAAQNKLKNARLAGGYLDIETAADKVIAEVDKANGVFESKGFPDDWSRWERAKDDARAAKLVSRRGGRL